MSSPSRRAAAETAKRQKKRAHLAHTDPEDSSRPPPANALYQHRRVPPFASSRRPLTHALGHLQWQEPPGFINAKATSPAAIKNPSPSHDPTTRPLWATGESAPSVTLPPPSEVAACQRVAPRGTRSQATRRSARATQARGASGVLVGQPAPPHIAHTSHSKRATRSFPGPRSAWGGRALDLRRAETDGFVTNRHGWRFVSLRRFG